jgi:hypothetical protein
MNLKRIIREEMDEFGWIKNTNPMDTIVGSLLDTLIIRRHDPHVYFKPWNYNIPYHVIKDMGVGDFGDSYYRLREKFFNYLDGGVDELIPLEFIPYIRNGLSYEDKEYIWMRFITGILKQMDFKTINELLGKHKKCVILYLNSVNYGHWTCIYEYNGTIYFFDSYGIKPNGELNWIPNHMNKKLKQDHKHLLKLLYDSKKPIEYNEYPLQKFGQGINTCGKWCVMRYYYYSRGYTNQQFVDAF